MVRSWRNHAEVAVDRGGACGRSVGADPGHLLIGDLATIQSPDAGWERVPDFADVCGGLLRIQAATHTGDLDVEWTVTDGPLPDPGRRRGAFDTVLLPVRAHHLLASTFHGPNDTFTVDLPEAWTEVEVRNTSPRYGEFDGEFLDEAEPILLAFGRPPAQAWRYSSNSGVWGPNRCCSARDDVRRDRRGPR